MVPVWIMFIESISYVKTKVAKLGYYIMKRIHTLTGLRGIAALLVFISHCGAQSILPSFLGKGFGQIGVMLFFVLSGFLMTHLYIRGLQ